MFQREFSQVVQNLTFSLVGRFFKKICLSGAEIFSTSARARLHHSTLLPLTSTENRIRWWPKFCNPSIRMRRVTMSHRCKYAQFFFSHLRADSAFNFWHTTRVFEITRLENPQPTYRHWRDAFILSGNQRRLKCNAFTNKWCTSVGGATFSLR